MSKGVNKVILIGNCCKNPEVHYSSSGLAIANLSIATNEYWNDKQTGEKMEKVEFHRLVFFQRLAEVVGEYLVKGAKIYVEGSLVTEKYQDKQTGADRYATKIKCHEMQMLDGKPQQQAPQQQQYQPQGQQQQETQGTQRQRPPRQEQGGAMAGDYVPNQPTSGGTAQGEQFDDSDIPF